MRSAVLIFHVDLYISSSIQGLQGARSVYMESLCIQILFGQCQCKHKYVAKIHQRRKETASSEKNREIGGKKKGGSR